MRKTYNGRDLVLEHDEIKFLAVTDGIQNRLDKLAAITGGISEQAAAEMKKALAEALDVVKERVAKACVPGSRAQKRYLAIAKAITGKQEYIDRLTKGYNPLVTTGLSQAPTAKAPSVGYIALKGNKK